MSAIQGIEERKGSLPKEFLWGYATAAYVSLGLSD
jgi:hypothetical protein